VQSIFPGWRFAPPDAIAAFALHGGLLLGPRHAVTEGDWYPALSRFTIELRRAGAVVERGNATDVLGGPLSALRHLVGVLARDPVNPPLAAGEMVTTGTLTRALSVAPGERWSTKLSGIALDPIVIRFD
jgi:2-keto-4-pentenoate hydratase